MQESKRKTGDNGRKIRVLSADDSFRNWHMQESNFKENVPKKDPGKKERDRKSVKTDTKKGERQREEVQNKGVKSRKSNFLDLDLKHLMKIKTFLDPAYAKENRKARKNPEKAEKKDSVCQQEASTPRWDDFSFPRTWNNTNIYMPSELCLNGAKGRAGRERKRKRAEGTRKRNKSTHRLEVANLKNTALEKPKRNKKMKVIPSLDEFVSQRSNYMRESGGKAVVIYHRQNRRKYLHPHTGHGYEFEQIAFSGSCGTIDSRRSLSEPRKHSPKESYVTRRRTRFQVEPNKTPSPSDFHSAIDFFKQNTGTVEFKKFESINKSFTTLFPPNPWNEKYLVEKKNANNSDMYLLALEKAKSTTNVNSCTYVQLQKTAEKKLDLHKEMMRSEKMNKKKFWESIERSLNYRCALAEMFSSQSFVSSNESSRFFSSTESSTNRSTNIYVRESVISSYEGYSRFVTSNKPNSSNKSKPTKKPLPTNSKYRTVKTLLDRMLIKEDEEEEVVLREQIADEFSSQSSSDSAVLQNLDFGLGVNEQLSLMENTLVTESKSQLELLMSRLSNEIKKCLSYLQNLESVQNDTVLSGNDSKILSNEEEIPTNWKAMKNQTVFVYSTTEMKDDRNVRKNVKLDESFEMLRPGKTEFSLGKGNNLNDSIMSLTKEPEPPYSEARKTQSNLSLKSQSLADVKCSSEDLQERNSTAKEVRRKLEKYNCCEDCKILKDRIIKLETDLEKLEKKMPLYPSEYQESIKDCLESLNKTSDTFLKRLRSCAKLRLMGQDKKCRKDREGNSNRPSSAPGPVLHEFYMKKMDMRPSTSDCQLNVGMQITMENVDPVTGKVLGPAKSGPSQEGNIQCRLCQPGMKPLLMMDTDFTYNPETGMLFKKKSGNNSESYNESSSSRTCTSEKASTLSTTRKNSFSFPTRICSCMRLENEAIDLDSIELKTPMKISPHQSVVVSTAVVEPETKSLKNSARKSRSKESKKDKTGKVSESGKQKREKSPKSGKDKPGKMESDNKPKLFFFGKKARSLIPVRKKTTPNCLASTKGDIMSGDSSLSTITLLPIEFQNDPPGFPNKNFPMASKTERQTHERSSIVSEEFTMMEKSTQTYKKPVVFEREPKQSVDVGVQKRFPIKHCGVQAATKRRNEKVQTRLSENPKREEAFGDARGCATVTTVNTAIQADALAENKVQTKDVALQINLPTKENLKYINDLQIQKKVNMAIAELCFHLTQEHENEGV